MWKASFTSVLAVEKEVVLYKDLEDLLEAGITIAVEESSAQEGNFRLEFTLLKEHNCETVSKGISQKKRQKDAKIVP